MIGELKPYRVTGLTKRVTPSSEVNIPWLSVLPQQWMIVRSKRLFTARKERARPDDEQLSATQAYGVIPQSEYERRVGRKVVRITQHLDKRAHVERDDFVISMRSFQGGLERSWATGCIRSSYVVLKPSPDIHVEYYSYLLKCHDYIRALQATSNFIRDGQDLSFKNFCLVDLPLPSPEEQAAIAKFLSHANRKIERAIRAKRKLIALLNEQKQAIIHRAVTRGLDPNVKLKPSGIPWLGDVPEHWEVRRLSSVADFFSGKAHERHIDPTGLHICVTARFVSTDGMSRKRCTRNFLPASKGDVLMVMSDLPQGRALARAFLVQDDHSYAVNQRVCIIRPRKMIPAFLAYQSNRNWGLLQHDDRYNQTHLSNRDYKTLPLLCPPISEQESIVRFLALSVDHIPSVIARTEREIELLREYWTRLTADVVTGKLDVREAVKGLPKEAEELPAENLPEDELTEYTFEEEE